METTVKVKHLKQSARKIRFILNELRGERVNKALEFLSLSNKKASFSIKKAIESGISNLSNNSNTEFNQDLLYISEACADVGPSMKRFRPRAMGRASGILKRSCHLTLKISTKKNKG